jgi:hypothetical protein
MDRLLSFCHVKVREALQESDGAFGVDGVLGILNRTVFYVVLRKKLLRAFTAGSARAVVTPFQFVFHGRLLFGSRGNPRAWTYPGSNDLAIHQKVAQDRSEKPT